MIKFSEVEALFLNKYPTGYLVQRMDKKSFYNFKVSFSTDSKEYNYIVKSHFELLEKLKLTLPNMMTKSAYNNYQWCRDNQQSLLDAEGEEDEFFDEIVTYTDSERKAIIDKIAEYDEILKKAIVVD